MARVAVDRSHVDGKNPVTGQRFPFSVQHHNYELNLHNSKPPFPNKMIKPTFLLKPLGARLRLKTTQKKQVSTIQRNIHIQQPHRHTH